MFLSLIKFPGFSRVKRVYPWWMLFSFIIVSTVILFEIKIPSLFLFLVIIFLLKDIILDYELIKIKRPRVYWAEHAPLGLLVAIVGAVGYLTPFLSGYVTPLTAVLAFMDVILDVYKDLEEDPKVYFKT